MKTVTEKKTPKRIIVEKMRLDACKALDHVEIRHREKGRFGTIGSVQLDRVKTIPNGKVQIKYHSTWGSKTKVLKTDLPGDLMVVRRREATEEDGPDAGEPEVRTATHEGVRYRAIDPEGDVDELLLAAVQAGMGEGRTLTAMIGLGEMFAERIGSPSTFRLSGGFADDVAEGLEGRHRAMARGVVEKVVAMGGAPIGQGPGPGKSLALQHVAGLAAAGLIGDAHGEAEDRDPDMRRMCDWLGAFEDRGILRPGAKEKLMGSIWTEDELRDGRPNPGSVVIDS